MSDDKQFPTGQAWDDERIDSETDERSMYLGLREMDILVPRREARKLMRQLRDDLTAQLAAAQERERQRDGDWLAMLRDVAALSDAIDPDNEWIEADDDTLQEQFDPWQTVREARQRIAAAQERVESRGKAMDAYQQEIASLRAQVAELEGERDLYKAQAGMLEDNGRLIAWQAVNAEDEVKALRTQLAQQPAMPQPDWLAAFPPEWDRHPWANYAYLQPSFGYHDGIQFMWYYYECEPEWGERSWNWVDGKHGYENPVKRAPLSTFFSVKDTLQIRKVEGESHG